MESKQKYQQDFWGSENKISNSQVRKKKKKILKNNLEEGRVALTNTKALDRAEIIKILIHGQ